MGCAASCELLRFCSKRLMCSQATPHTLRAAPLATALPNRQGALFCCHASSTAAAREAHPAPLHHDRRFCSLRAPLQQARAAAHASDARCTAAHSHKPCGRGKSWFFGGGHDGLRFCGLQRRKVWTSAPRAIGCTQDTGCFQSAPLHSSVQRRQGQGSPRRGAEDGNSAQCWHCWMFRLSGGGATGLCCCSFVQPRGSFALGGIQKIRKSKYFFSHLTASKNPTQYIRAARQPV